MSELDEKIAKWLGLPTSDKCLRCGRARSEHYQCSGYPPIHAHCPTGKSRTDGPLFQRVVCPSYSTDPAACLDLCTALTDEKAYFVSTASGRDFSKTYWAVRLHGLLGDDVEARADTLPLAVALAVEKLIDGETE